MKHEVMITYEWWEKEGKYEVREEHREELEGVGLGEIKNMMVEGYTSGELRSSLYTADENGEYDVEYKGWWSLTTTSC